jgi:membrane fusion protein (multidrug efflux system)
MGCGEEKTVETAPVRPVVATPVAVRDLEERIEASGELLAKNYAEVAAQIAGEVTEIAAEEGDAVAEGAIVIEIDPEKRQLEVSVARARLAEARAAVAEQKREVARMEALAAQKIAATTRLDAARTARETAESRREAARAQLGTAERSLRDATVRARFAGLIARRFVSRGEFVNAGQKLFELVSLDPIEVEFHLPEADSSRIHKGVDIEVTVAPYPDDVFDAVVHIVSPTIDTRTRTLRVKALIDNADGRLRPGLFARANLGIAQRSEVIMVPEEALLRRADGNVVFRVVSGNRVERMLVETGTIREGWVEISSGLQRDDRVITRGHSDLIDGSVIATRNPDGTPTVSGSPQLAGGDAASGATP